MEGSRFNWFAWGMGIIGVVIAGVVTERLISSRSDRPGPTEKSTETRPASPPTAVVAPSVTRPVVSPPDKVAPKAPGKNHKHIDDESRTVDQTTDD